MKNKRFHPRTNPGQLVLNGHGWSATGTKLLLESQHSRAQSPNGTVPILGPSDALIGSTSLCRKSVTDGNQLTLYFSHTQWTMTVLSGFFFPQWVQIEPRRHYRSLRFMWVPRSQISSKHLLILLWCPDVLRSTTSYLISVPKDQKESLLHGPC